jgi:AcrR family transcriptional regulator
LSPKVVEAAPESEASGGRRVGETRERLLAAARRLFVQGGYHATRPQDITRAAGVGHGTFYQYFPDKLACFLAFADQTSVELGNRVRASLVGADTFEEILIRGLRVIFAFEREQPDVLLTIMNNPRMLSAEYAGKPGVIERWVVFWAEMLVFGQKRNEVRLDLNLELAGASIVGVMAQAGAHGFRRGVNEETILEHIRRFVMNGVSPAASAGGQAA